MRLDLPPTPARWLSYCSNALLGDDLKTLCPEWIRLYSALAQQAGGRGSGMAAGLWLPAPEIEALRGDQQRLATLRETLLAAGIQPLSFNAFPQSAFQSGVVKTAVYRPNWAEDARLDFTLGVASVLAALLPDGETHATLSTLPLGYRGLGSNLEVATRAADAIARVAEAFARRADETGVTLVLGLEPEPGCILETSDDVLTWFDVCFSAALERLPEVCGQSGLEYGRRHVGVCLDTCHHAILFEEPQSARNRYEEAGIQIAKMQLSNALIADASKPEDLDALASFSEPRFLHQVATRNAEGQIRVHEDLPQALERLRAEGGQGIEARCHFHVPIHEASVRGLKTTQPALEALLEAERAASSTRFYEVETYTHGIQPVDQSEVLALMAEEFRWAKERLHKKDG